MAFIPTLPTVRRRITPTSAICQQPVTPPAITSAFRPTIFHIEKTVMPADSDYSMALWHGSYVRWLEEARVQYLAHINLPYDHLVQTHRTELVVRDLQVRYKAPVRLGDHIFVTIDLSHDARLKIPIHSRFVRADDGVVFATAHVCLAAVDADSGKLRRRWPQVLSDAFRHRV